LTLSKILIVMLFGHSQVAGIGQCPFCADDPNVGKMVTEATAARDAILQPILQEISKLSRWC
jgi:hypothetical protein